MLFGTVTGRIVATIADRIGDPDVNPDVVPVYGKVRFTPSVDAATSSSEGAIVLPTPIEADLDSEGYLSVNGVRGVSLVATDSPDLNPTGFTYTVTFIDLKFDKFPLAYKSFSMALPAGSTVDLSTVTPVGSSNGALIIRGMQGEDGAPGGTFTYDETSSMYTAPGAEYDIPSTKVAVTTNGTSDITVLKSASDTRPGVWEWVHNSPNGYLMHLLTGEGTSNASALLGLGIDNSGQGIFINNKKTGVGIAIQQNNSITSPTAYGMYANQSSSVAPLIHIDHANGARHALRVISSESSVETNELIECITTGVSGGGFISARSGTIYWKSDINATQGSRLRSVQNVAADGNSTAMEPDALRLSTWNGGNGGYWQKRIAQNGQSLLLQGADGTSGGRDAAATWFTAVETKQTSNSSNGTQVGFYGVTPVARQAAPPAATDLASAIAAVNAMRTALISLGLLV